MTLNEWLSLVSRIIIAVTGWCFIARWAFLLIRHWRANAQARAAQRHLQSQSESKGNSPQ